MTSAQQRAALQRQIWAIANDVRGAVDGWDFKQCTHELASRRLAPRNRAAPEAIRVLPRFAAEHP